MNVRDVLMEKMQRLQISVEAMQGEPSLPRTTRGSVIRREKYSRNYSMCRKHDKKYRSNDQCPECIAETQRIQLYLQERMNSSLEKRYLGGDDIVADLSISDTCLRQFFDTAFYATLDKKYLKRDFDSCLAARTDFALTRDISYLLETKNVKYKLRYTRDSEFDCIRLQSALRNESNKKCLMGITNPVQEPWLLLSQGIVPDPRQKTTQTEHFFNKLELLFDSRLSSYEDMKIWFETECCLSEVASLRYWIIYC